MQYNITIDCVKRTNIHIICTCLILTLLIGCRSDYPYIEYEGNPGKAEFNNIDSCIPIMLSIDKAFFESYTRGMGAFDEVEDKSSIDDIRIFAFYTPKGISDGPDSTDYTERMNTKDNKKFHCLVDDANNDNIGHGKRARPNSGNPSLLEWVDGDKVYYSNKHPQFRYHFFAYHIDDAANMNEEPNRYTDYVAYNIALDGTQDLMYSCAQPTKEQLAQIAKLADSNNKSFIHNLNKLTYSTESAFRDLIPVFKMKHQLAFVKFFLKAEKVAGADTLDPAIENVRVRNITIKDAPFEGEFIVAAEDTTQLGITFSTETTDYYMPVEKEGHIISGNKNGFAPLTPDSTGCWIGAGLLLPPIKTHTLELDCYIDENKNGFFDNGEGYVQTFKLIPPKGFEPGHQYEVNIKVYGPRNISLQWGAIEWKEGDDIDVGEER